MAKTKLNGWLKWIAGAVLTIALFVVGHLIIWSRNMNGRVHAVETECAVGKERDAAIKETLDEIKRDVKTILSKHIP